LTNFAGTIRHKSYIKPLDGLRAIAILLVLVFHLDERYLPGGFIGVDIFFTISGFIISRNLYNESDYNYSSILNFYHKRIARLLPAVMVTVLVSLFAASFIYNSITVSGFAKAGLYSIVSFANMYFLGNAGYFDDASQTNIFLHTWSLSVEEQFYLIWPFLMLILWRFLKKSPSMLIWIFVISLTCSWFISIKSPTAAFYLMPSRIFQFSLGAFIAWFHTHHRKNSPFDLSLKPILGNTIFIVGILMIGAASVAANGESYNFFMATVLPVLGASAVLVSINSKLSKSTLGLKIMRVVGKRAYAIYLVHWPTIVMAGVFFGGFKPIHINIGLVVFCFLVAELLHQIVEKPLRLRGSIENKRMDKLRTGTVFIGIAISLVVAANYWASPSNTSDGINEVAGRSIISKDEPSEAESLLNKDISSIPILNNNSISTSYTTYAGSLWKERSMLGRIDIGCQISLKAPYTDFNVEACLPRDMRQKKILILGDSYAPESLIMLSQVFGKENLLLAGASGCWPIYPEPNWANRHLGCRELNQKRFEWVKRGDVAAVVLASNWQHWKPEHFRPTIQYLIRIGKPLIIMGERPIFSTRVPTLLDGVSGKSAASNLNKYLSYDTNKVKDMLLKVIKDEGGKTFYVDIMSYLCLHDVCQAFTPIGGMIYLDNTHISADTAIYVGREINRYIGDKLREFVGHLNENDNS
jgi:peptidoglycan/LPS O-acetylase OafA/YrhL